MGSVFNNHEAALVFKAGSVTCSCHRLSQGAPWLDVREVETQGSQGAVLQERLLRLGLHSHFYLATPGVEGLHLEQHNHKPFWPCLLQLLGSCYVFS